MDRKLYPTGAVPRIYWRLRVIEGRLQELNDAIAKYRAANLDPMPEWVEEFRELRDEYSKLEATLPLGLPSKVAGVGK